MSEHTQQPRTSAESPQNRERQAPTEYVERSDVGVSLTVKLTRGGTGTRDQDKITGQSEGQDARRCPRGIWKPSASISTTSLRTLARSSQLTHTNSTSFDYCTELCNQRMYEVCGEKELKVVLALDPEDSISGVARKIDENRETIRRVVHRLEEAGYVAYDDGLHLVDQAIQDVGLEFLTASANISPPSIAEAYVLPQFASMDYAFTSIDAVYVWTRGGYQVALATQRTIRCSSPSTNPTSTLGRRSSIDLESRLQKSASPLPTSMVRYRLFWSYGHRSKPRWSMDGPSSHSKKRRRSQTSTTRTSSRRSTCSAACTTASTLTRITVQTDLGF